MFTHAAILIRSPHNSILNSLSNIHFITQTSPSVIITQQFKYVNVCSDLKRTMGRARVTNQAKNVLPFSNGVKELIMDSIFLEDQFHFIMPKMQDSHNLFWIYPANIYFHACTFFFFNYIFWN